jgi:hypothetical protein
MLVQASLSAGGIGAYRFARVWTPLQRQYLWSYVWSAVAISRRGSYELLVIVDQQHAVQRSTRTSSPSHQRERRHVCPHGDGRQPWADCLAWQRGEWDHAALHAWLRQWVYEDQTFRDLARPPLWGAWPCSRRPWSR